MDNRTQVSAQTAAVETEVEVELGRLLRLWRAKRSMSQMDLAMAADVSARHISFLETGRAHATVDMVLRLADVLQVPLRDRNPLLMAAGFAPLHREIGLEAPELEQIRQSLKAFLENQEPFPALVVDRYFNIVMENQANQRRLTLFFDAKRLWGDGPRNIVQMFLSEQGLRPLIEDWEKVAQWAMEQVYRQAHEAIGDPVTQAMFEEFLSYPGVRALWRVPDPDYKYPPVLHVTVRKFGLRLSSQFMMTTFGTSQDVYLKELRIICGYPMNEMARRFALWLAKTRGKREISTFK
ncbi:MAG: helix-turn-helix domain-containing protein [Nevskiales bacterium]